MTEQDRAEKIEQDKTESDIKKRTTLAEKIKDLLLIKRKERQRANATSPRLYDSCIICGTYRIDGDVTGLTCGKEECLLSLAREFKEVEERLLLIATDVLGLKLPEEKIGLPTLCEMIGGEIEKIAKVVGEAR